MTAREPRGGASRSVLRRLHVAVGVERDVSGWSQAHEAGERPSRWPYGLDQLAPASASGVAPLIVPRDSRARRAGRILRAALPRHGAGDTVVTWDENLYARVAPLPRGTRSLSGVIWLTDADANEAWVRHRVRQLRWADALWCLSTAQVGPLRGLVGPLGPPVHYVEFGVDGEFYAVAPPAEGRPVVVSAGGDRDRDIPTLLEAMEQVVRAVPEVEVIVQTGRAGAAPEGVTVVPRLTHRELRDLYRRSTVVVVATRQNLHVSGMTVALEAMATGRPVVMSNTPGMDGYVRDGETGHVTDGVESMVEATVGLLRDRDRADAYGRAARADVESRFTTSTMCERLSSLVDALPD